MIPRPSRFHHVSARSFAALCRTKRPQVNQNYEPQRKPIPELTPKPNAGRDTFDEIHNAALNSWSDEQVNDALSKHCLMAWGATDPMLSNAAGGERSGTADPGGLFQLGRQSCSGLCQVG